VWAIGGQSQGYWVLFMVLNDTRGCFEPIYGYVPAEGWTETVSSNWQKAFHFPDSSFVKVARLVAQELGAPTSHRSITRQVWIGNEPLSVRLQLEFFSGMLIGGENKKVAEPWYAGKGLLAMASPGALGEGGDSLLTSPGPPVFDVSTQKNVGRNISVTVGGSRTGDGKNEGKPIVSFDRAILSSVSVAWSSIISKQGFPTFARCEVVVQSGDVRSSYEIMKGLG